MSSKELLGVAPRHKDKRASSDLVNILTTANPEIFKACPRPGGYAIPARANPEDMAEACLCHEDDLEVVYSKRSHSSITSSTKTKPTISSARTTRSTFNTGNESDLEMTNIQLDSLNMLAVTISCVMLMASDSKVPEEHMKWAETYLKCIKTEEDQHPPNIQGILNHIRYLKDPKKAKSKDSVGKGGGSRSQSREKVDDNQETPVGKKPSSSSGKQRQSSGRIPRRTK